MARVASRVESSYYVLPKFLASPVKKFGPEVVLPTQPHPARKASHRDQAALRSNHLDPLAWPYSPLCLTVQKFSSLGLIYYFSQISSVLFHCLLSSKKEHNCISMSKLINCRMEAEMLICSNCWCILRIILHSHYMEKKIHPFASTKLQDLN